MKVVTKKMFDRWINDLYESWLNRDRKIYKNLKYYAVDDNTAYIINKKTGKLPILMHIRMMYHPLPPELLLHECDIEIWKSQKSVDL